MGIAFLLSFFFAENPINFHSLCSLQSNRTVVHSRTARCAMFVSFLFLFQLSVANPGLSAHKTNETNSPQSISIDYPPSTSTQGVPQRLIKGNGVPQPIINAPANFYPPRIDGRRSVANRYRQRFNALTNDSSNSLPNNPKAIPRQPHTLLHGSDPETDPDQTEKFKLIAFLL